MKFDDIKELTQKEIRKTFPQKINKIDPTVENIRDIQLYENFAIYIMQPGTKGNFQEISKLANDGTEAASWSSRIYLNKNSWVVHAAPHPGIKKEDIDFNLKDFVSEHFIGKKNLDINGNSHVVKFKTPYKKDVEEIISALIKELKNHKLKGIDQQPLFEDYVEDVLDKNFSIGFTTVSIDKLDEQTYRKYLLMIKKMMDKGLEEEEKQTLMKISKTLFEQKSLSEKMSLELNELIYNNLTQKEKIEIAMRYLQEGLQ